MSRSCRDSPGKLGLPDRLFLFGNPLAENLGFPNRIIPSLCSQESQLRHFFLAARGVGAEGGGRQQWWLIVLNCGERIWFWPQGNEESDEEEAKEEIDADGWTHSLYVLQSSIMLQIYSFLYLSILAGAVPLTGNTTTRTGIVEITFSESNNPQAMLPNSTTTSPDLRSRAGDTESTVIGESSGVTSIATVRSNVAPSTSSVFEPHPIQGRKQVNPSLPHPLVMRRARPQHLAFP
ncbi:hypothetical protein R3P38DRAFT_2793529 [Favolaschia claudopus]|uniref:Uncharacterized protein n=1 Tax=Favolaschia claudopus TaxID=2862362 RepID=A0AAW0ADM6_9AGAR